MLQHISFYKSHRAFAENLLSGSDSSGTAIFSNITVDGMIVAAVTMSAVPIIAAYPFVQKFVMKGITIGSVKG